MEALKGKKTYIVAVLVALVAAAQQLGYISAEAATTLLTLLGASGMATFAAKINRLDVKMILVPLFVLGLAASASAQAIPTDKLAWDQPAPDLATAQAYTYKYYPAGATVGITLTGVTCLTAGTPAVISCRTTFPAFTPGSHTITITASNAAGESPKSAPFTFTFVVVPGVPSSIRIEK
jgi:hypothetical protein